MRVAKDVVLHKRAGGCPILVGREMFTGAPIRVKVVAIRNYDMVTDEGLIFPVNGWKWAD